MCKKNWKTECTGLRKSMAKWFNRLSREHDKASQAGSVTIESAIVLMMFLAFYIVIISITSLFTINMTMQNIVNQTAKEIAQYAYLAKKSGMVDSSGNDGGGTLGNAELVQNITVFTTAFMEGFDQAKKLVGKKPPGVEDDFDGILSGLEEMKNQNNSAQAKEKVEESLANYREKVKNQSQVQLILSCFKAMSGKGGSEIGKIGLGAILSEVIADKYLEAYNLPTTNGSEYLENLGVVGGRNGLSFAGSSLFLEPGDIEVSVVYKIRVKVPFFDKYELNLRNTACTRAWIGE